MVEGVSHERHRDVFKVSPFGHMLWIGLIGMLIDFVSVLAMHLECAALSALQQIQPPLAL